MPAERPFYVPVGNEEAVFAAAFHQGLSILLKGPTGCGKTRFVEAMAHQLGRPLITVACHDDLTTADLVGRYLLKGGETVWVDGPLTRAVREGAICYLDEIVEARQDTTVVLHPLADHRRQLPLDRLGVTLDAAPGFCLVVSYNPGYQSVLKDLKDSTRQRMVGIELTFPAPEIEEGVLAHEAGIDPAAAARLVQLGQAIRRVETSALREVASTRVLVAAGRLMATGLPAREAARAAIAGPLTDDPAVTAGLHQLIDAYVEDQPAGATDRAPAGAASRAPAGAASRAPAGSNLGSPAPASDSPDPTPYPADESLPAEQISGLQRRSRLATADEHVHRMTRFGED